MGTTTIQHIVVLPANISINNTSFFQGFSREIFDEYLWIFNSLPTVPHDITDIFTTEDDYVDFKMTGSQVNILVIKAELLDKLHIELNRAFSVIWSTKSSLQSSVDASYKFDHKPVHISTEKNENSIYLGDLTKEIVVEIFKDFIRRVCKSHKNNKFTSFLGGLLEIENRKTDKKKLPFLPLGHACTAPMVKVLSTYGYYFDKIEEITPSGDTSQHIKGILLLSNLIDSIRGKCNLPKHTIQNDKILFCPSIYAALYKANSPMWNEINRKLNRDTRSFLKNALIRNKGYGNLTISVKGDYSSILEDKIITVLLHERQSELKLFTDIISIIAANQFCSAIRMPNSVMLHHGSLKAIVSLIKFPNKNNIRHLNKLVATYSENIKNDLGTEICEISFSKNNKILSICDFPLEWINFNGFPVMFTHEISRIPSTPGNLFTQMAISVPRIAIPYSEFKEILILRSFDKNDPIKNHLQIAIDTASENGCYDNINIKVVDITTKDELINSLNDFNGLIVIFDCHGSHDGENVSGWLKIGTEKVDVWYLANKCRIPPIVILSACSTHPIDGSHASVTNGLFRCGAISVIGTYAPIAADHAGRFVSRLLHRISAFVPLVIKRRPISWREIVSGFLRMSYATDVLFGLRDDIKIITDAQYREIGTKANFLINSSIINWTEKFIQLIEDETAIGSDKLQTIITENFQFVETMLYSQLGRPENIIIVKDGYE